MRYTFSDDEDDSDNISTRRSTRNSGISTPAEHAGPTVTASGRQVKSRLGGMYGETMLVDQRKELENERAAAVAVGSERDQEESGEGQPSTRPRRPIRPPRRIDDSSEEMNGESDVASSGNEWSGNEDEPDEPDAEEFEVEVDDEDDEMSANDSEMDDAPPEQDSLVVQLRYKKGENRSKLKGGANGADGGAAAADCIVVDSGQPPTQIADAQGDTVHLNGAAFEGEDTQHKAGASFQLLPPNSVNGKPSRPISGPENAHYPHQSFLKS
jgi:hypothetical protein